MSHEPTPPSSSDPETPARSSPSPSPESNRLHLSLASLGIPEENGTVSTTPRPIFDSWPLDWEFPQEMSDEPEPTSESLPESSNEPPKLPSS